MGTLFKHCAFKKKDQLVAMVTEKEYQQLTRAILRSAPTTNIDHIFHMIRIKIPVVLVFVVFVVVVIITIVVFALIIKAYLFVWFNVPSSKYGEKRFLNVAFVNVACIQSAVWVTGMVLRDKSFAFLSENGIYK